jgi:hypothetical protein
VPPGDRSSILYEYRPSAGRRRQFAQLKPRELDEGRGSGRPAPTLEQGEHGEKSRLRHRLGIQLDSQRDGVAGGRSRQVGREMQKEVGHVVFR